MKRLIYILWIIFFNIAFVAVLIKNNEKAFYWFFLTILILGFPNGFLTMLFFALIHEMFYRWIGIGIFVPTRNSCIDIFSINFVYFLLSWGASFYFQNRYVKGLLRKNWGPPASG